MNLLIDECLPRKLKRFLGDYNVRTVQEMGWSGVKNGKLLKLAATEFDIFITFDHSIEYQQNIASSEIGIIVLVASSNRLSDLEPVIPNLIAMIANVKKGQLVHISKDVEE